MVRRITSGSRRDFLQASSSLLLGSLLSPQTRNSLALAQDAVKHAPPPAAVSNDTRMKFFETGEPRPFAGNTVICHLPQQCEFRDAVTAFGAALRTSAVASNLAILPPDSYHLTVFSGATDQVRARDSWPSDIPLRAPIADCNRIMRERFASFSTQCSFPLRMRLDVEETVAYRGAITLRMRPLDTLEEKKIRALRDRIAELYKYRARDHDTYAFHIGLAYRIKPFSDADQAAYQELINLHVRAIAQSVPYLEVGLPAYCTFDTMFRFDIRKLLNS